MVTNPTATNYLTVYPGGTARPGASNLNFLAGQTIPTWFWSLAGGTVTFFNRCGTVDVLANIGGYYK